MFGFRLRQKTAVFTTLLQTRIPHEAKTENDFLPPVFIKFIISAAEIKFAKHNGEPFFK